MDSDGLVGLKEPVELVGLEEVVEFVVLVEFVELDACGVIRGLAVYV